MDRCPLVRLTAYHTEGHYVSCCFDPLSKANVLDRCTASALCPKAAKKISRSGSLEFVAGYSTPAHYWSVACRLLGQRPRKDANVKFSDCTIHELGLAKLAVESGDLICVGTGPSAFRAKISLEPRPSSGSGYWFDGAYCRHSRSGIAVSVRELSDRVAMKVAPLLALRPCISDALDRSSLMATARSDVGTSMPERATACRPTLRFLALAASEGSDPEERRTEPGCSLHRAVGLDAPAIAALCEHDDAVGGSEPTGRLHSLPLGFRARDFHKSMRAMRSAPYARMPRETAGADKVATHGGGFGSVSLLDWPVCLLPSDFAEMPTSGKLEAGGTVGVSLLSEGEDGARAHMVRLAADRTQRRVIGTGGLRSAAGGSSAPVLGKEKQEASFESCNGHFGYWLLGYPASEAMDFCIAFRRLHLLMRGGSPSVKSYIAAVDASIGLRDTPSAKSWRNHTPRRAAEAKIWTDGAARARSSSSRVPLYSAVLQASHHHLGARLHAWNAQQNADRRQSKGPTRSKRVYIRVFAWRKPQGGGATALLSLLLKHGVISRRMQEFAGFPLDFYSMESSQTGTAVKRFRYDGRTKEVCKCGTDGPAEPLPPVPTVPLGDILIDQDGLLQLDPSSVLSSSSGSHDMTAACGEGEKSFSNAAYGDLRLAASSGAGDDAVYSRQQEPTIGVGLKRSRNSIGGTGVGKTLSQAGLGDYQEEVWVDYSSQLKRSRSERGCSPPTSSEISLLPTTSELARQLDSITSTRRGVKIEARGSSPPSLEPYRQDPGKYSSSGTVFWQGAASIGIWDPYPKGRMHALFLPTPGTLRYPCLDTKKQSSLDGFIRCRAPAAPQETVVCQRVSDLTWKYNGTELRRFHAEASAVAEYLLRRLSSDTAGPAFGPLQMCYHLKPSLRPLHMHAITLDMDSECCKTRRHLQSFLSTAAIKASELEAQLVRHPSKPLDEGWCVATYEAGIRSPIRCEVCGSEHGSYASFRAHLPGCVLSDSSDRSLADAAGGGGAIGK